MRGQGTFMYPGFSGKCGLSWDMKNKKRLNRLKWRWCGGYMEEEKMHGFTNLRDFMAWVPWSLSMMGNKSPPIQKHSLAVTGVRL